MPVLFKYGKFATKRYDKLCPNKLVYLRAGKYMLDLETESLKCLEEDIDPIDLNALIPLKFYIDLDVDYTKNKKISLILDRRGIFSRRSGCCSTIETLFLNETKKGEKS